MRALGSPRACQLGEHGFILGGKKKAEREEKAPVPGSVRGAQRRGSGGKNRVRRPSAWPTLPLTHQCGFLHDTPLLWASDPSSMEPILVRNAQGSREV